MREEPPWNDFVAPAIGMVIAFIGFVLIAQNSDSFQNCIENYQYKAAQSSFPKHIADIPITLGARVNCWGAYIHTVSEGIIAVFTVVLAGFTIALWFSTKQLWKVTDETLRHTESTAERELRAYIGVEPRGVKRLSGKDELLGHIAICNFGKIPAKKVSYYAVTDYYSDEEKMVYKFGEIYQSKTVLAPRAKMVFGTASVVRIDDIMVTDDGNADYVGFIFVYGKVTYTHEFNTEGGLNFATGTPVK
jgi:hypothetical protein